MQRNGLLMKKRRKHILSLIPVDKRIENSTLDTTLEGNLFIQMIKKKLGFLDSYEPSVKKVYFLIKILFFDRK